MAERGHERCESGARASSVSGAHVGLRIVRERNEVRHLGSREVPERHIDLLRPRLVEEVLEIFADGPALSEKCLQKGLLLRNRHSIPGRFRIVVVGVLAVEHDHCHRAQ